MIMVTVPLPLSTHPARLHRAAAGPAPAGHGQPRPTLAHHDQPGLLPHPGVLQEGELGHLAAQGLIVVSEGIAVTRPGLSVLAHGSAGEDRNSLADFNSSGIPAF